jgi:hypothetical protein
MKHLAFIFWSGLIAALLTGCATADESVRTERGPLLRTFERPSIVEGGVHGKLTADWPSMKLELQGYDTCRTEKIEEYAEDKIHERKGAGAGASISAGVVFTAASAIVFGVSYVLSNDPNMQRIDGAGNYGAPPRTTARAWSIGLLCVGVPALVVGLVQGLRTGEEIETVKVEEVSNQRDEQCHQRAVDGPVWLRASNGTPVGPLTSTHGAVTIDAASLKTDVDAFYFYEREVGLDDASESLLAAFNGCTRLERESAAALDALSMGALVKRLEAARACRQIRGEAVAPEVQRLEGELGRRKEGGEVVTVGKKLGSFEEAVSTFPPRYVMEDGSPDSERSAETLTGQSVLVRGRVQAGLSPNIGVVTYASREMFVFLPADASWASEDFPLGTQVEVIGIVSGLQTVGARTAPLLKAKWMRKVSKP